MAGTPTTNYNIPTYADTDAPDLSGAYNDAMGIIDTQLKANADAIESASTGNYTGTRPVTVDNESRIISVSEATMNADTHQHIDAGVVKVTGAADTINTNNDISETVVPNRRAVADYVAAHGGTTYTAGEGILISGTAISNASAGYVQISDGTVSKTTLGGVYRCVDGPAVDIIAADSSSDSETKTQSAQTVPTVKALRAYVESKMATAGVAYTGTAPIVVDNGSHAISVNTGTSITDSNIASIEETGLAPANRGVVRGIATVGTVIDRLAALTGEEHGWACDSVVSAYAVKGYVTARTPDASTSVKGLVQLTTGMDTADSTFAITGRSIANQRDSESCLPVNVSALSNLVYNPASGMVFYKAPTA